MSWTITPSNSLVDDQDALTYLTAVETADGQALESSVRLAVNAFVKGCKADGIWPAIKASCILAGARTLNGSLTPLVGAAPTRLGTEGGWNYNRKTGLQANGTNNAINTNRNNNADPDANCHNAVYVTATVSNGNNSYMGADAAGSANEIRCIPQAAANRFQNRGGTFDLANGHTATGLIGTSRLSTLSYSYRNQSTTGTVAAAAGTPGSVTIRIFSNSADRFSNARIAFYSIGEGLDLSLLNTRVTTLVNALAAAIP